MKLKTFFDFWQLVDGTKRLSSQNFSARLPKNLFSMICLANFYQFYDTFSPRLVKSSINLIFLEKDHFFLHDHLLAVVYFQFAGKISRKLKRNMSSIIFCCWNREIDCGNFIRKFKYWTFKHIFFARFKPLYLLRSPLSVN